MKILDSSGRPMPSAASYKAADSMGQELARWNPRLSSADKAMIPEKARAEGRAWDLVRNNGYARGAVQSQKDRVVGAQYKLQLTPIYKILGIDAVAAATWASLIEVKFHAWADDPDCWIDAQRKRNFTQFIRESTATDMVQGECVVVRRWRPSPVGISTCFTTVEPERLSNPLDTGLGVVQYEVTLPNGNRLRNGVELDTFGAAVAYHVRTRHPNDFGYNYMSVAGVWERIEKFNEYGWLQVIHLFEPEKADQARGFSSMASTLQKLKMMDMQEDLELQSSQLLTAYAMYIKTALGRQRAEEIMGVGSGDSTAEYEKFARIATEAQGAYYGSSGMNINGTRIPILRPDDEIGVVQPHNQPMNHEQFKQGLNRQTARSYGMSYEEFSGDFSQTSYSSARASMQMAWQYILSKRASVADKLASHIFRLWFDEALVKGTIDMPPGVTYWPDQTAEMAQKFSALTRCQWVGAGKVVIDDFKQAKANEVGVNSYQFTLPDVHAENGTDLERVLDDNVRTRQMFQERGLPLPEYLGGIPMGVLDPATVAENTALVNDSNAN